MQLTFTVFGKDKKEIIKKAISLLNKELNNHDTNCLDSNNGFEFDFIDTDNFLSLYDQFYAWQDKQKQEEFYDE